MSLPVNRSEWTAVPFQPWHRTRPVLVKEGCFHCGRRYRTKCPRRSLFCSNRCAQSESHYRKSRRMKTATQEVFGAVSA